MRNELLNFFKFILIMLVCFHHTGWWSNIVHHGYIAVEFFFIISGFFLYQTYKFKRITQREYFKRRLKRIYPTYVAILIIYMLSSIVNPNFFNEYNISINGWIITAIRDLLLLQSVGVDFNVDIVRFNPPDWYISALFWGGVVLYGLLKFKYRKLILFIIIVCTYSFYFIFKVGGLNDLWGYYYVFYMPLWRALAGMSTGILLGMAIENEAIKGFLCKNVQIFNVLTLISIGVVCFCIITPHDYDILCYLCFVCIVTNLFIPQGLERYFSRNKYFRSIPDISFEILLLHKILIIVSVKIASIIGVLDIPIIKYIMYAFITISVSLFFNKKVTPFLQRIIT